MSQEHGMSRAIIIEEEDDLEDVIPGPTNASNGTTPEESHGERMDASLTKHRIKGDGILASPKDLDMSPMEFAAGCNLLQAAARGDLDMVRELLRLRPHHRNFRDYDRRTALHVAASEGRMSVVSYLVEHGAKIHRSDRWGGSALDDAHRHRHADVARYLRKHGATTGSLNNTTNLITASSKGDLDEVLLLLGSVKDVDEGDYDKRTALHLASGEGHASVVLALLQAGANPNSEDRWGGRPLDDAFHNQHRECMEMLKNFGATRGHRNGHRSRSPARSSRSLRRRSNDIVDDDEEEEDRSLRIDFDELEMIERIGAGAFGEIYKCRWRGTLVAAKLIKSARIRAEWLAKHALNMADGDEAARMLDEVAEMEKNEGALEDFRKEISVLKSLRHPNICLLLAYSTTEDREVMISELMQCSLLDVFKSHLIHGTRMKHPTQISYAQQLAQGMNYLHTCKPPVIHRDLKPANLLIDHSGGLKISDFGLAKIRPDPGVQDEYRMTGETGSYRFMAPEVYRNEDYDETVDIYSYAMILFNLFHGKPPWHDVNGLVAAKKAALEAERPHIPREWDNRLSDLLQQCWDENNKVRPRFQKIIDILGDYSVEKFKSQRDSVSSVPPPPLNMGRATLKCRCLIL